MSNAELLQLVKDYTEGKAHQQVEFYIASTPNPSFEGLIDNLRTSFQSGEDEATVKGEFYSHKQYSKESVDNFVDVLQLLVSKVLNVDSVIPNIHEQIDLSAISQWPKRSRSWYICKVNP